MDNDRRPLPSWSKILSLRLRDIYTLGQIVGLLGKLLLLQGKESLPDLVRSFDAVSASSQWSEDDLNRARKLTNGLLSYLYGHQYCLQRSFILFHIYRKGGYPVKMRFGITRRKSQLTGHAWLDLDGTPFSEHGNPDRDYQTIFVYPSSSNHDL